jgi:hypothetical protein
MPMPIQTGAPAQIRAMDRSSGTPAVLVPSRYVASVDHTGLLRRSARCSVIRTQRARMQQRPSCLRDRLRFCMCGLVLCGSSAGRTRRKNGLPHPGRGREGHVAVCMPAARKRPSSSSTRQANEVGREGPLASDIGSFSHGRAAQTLGAHKISLHKAASEVRHIAIFNNAGGTTGHNAASCRHTRKKTGRGAYWLL